LHTRPIKRCAKMYPRTGKACMQSMKVGGPKTCTSTEQGACPDMRSSHIMCASIHHMPAMPPKGHVVMMCLGDAVIITKQALVSPTKHGQRYSAVAAANLYTVLLQCRCSGAATYLGSTVNTLPCVLETTQKQLP
jgi:hypothetical protein